MLQPHRARAQGQGGPEVVKRPPVRRWLPGLGAGDCRAGRSCAWATVLGEAGWPAWAWGSRWTEPLPGGLSASPSHTEQWGHWPQRGSGPRGALGTEGQALALHQAWRTEGAVECQHGPGSHLVAGEWAHLLLLQMVETPEAWVGGKGAPEAQLTAGPRAQALQGDTCTQWVTGEWLSHGSRGTQEHSPGLLPTPTWPVWEARGAVWGRQCLA